MPSHSPLQLGAPLDVSNGLRTSLMSLQQEQTAVQPTSGQNHRADIYRVIQDQYVNFPLLAALMLVSIALESWLFAIFRKKHGLLIRDRYGFPKYSFE